MLPIWSVQKFCRLGKGIQKTISCSIFEKGQPRNISTKFFQNLASGFRGEDF